MYGIEAINEANGWSLAALGILVVFSSLVILSIIISQLHKVLILWEKRKNLWPGNQIPEKSEAPESQQPHPEIGDEKESSPSGETQALPHPHTSPEDINEIAAIWAPLALELGDPFRLTDLYKTAAKHNFPHPHLTINRLRRENIILPADDGMFTFRHKPEECPGDQDKQGDTTDEKATEPSAE